MKRLSPLKAIRANCLDCCGGSSKEVELCSANPRDISLAEAAGDETPYKGCFLYEYRFGRNPARRGLGGNTRSFKRRKKTPTHDGVEAQLE